MTGKKIEVGEINEDVKEKGSYFQKVGQCQMLSQTKSQEMEGFFVKNIDLRPN